MVKSKYCVANVSINCLGESKVTYYACYGGYGLHLVSDINNESILWYDTLEEARGHIINGEGECVIRRLVEHIPKFTRN